MVGRVFTQVAATLTIFLAAPAAGPASYDETDSEAIRGPAWFRQAAVVYSTCDAPIARTGAGAPAGVDVTKSPPILALGGLTGGCLDTTSEALVLRSARFSPHRPWALSFWWALPRDLPIDGSFGLFALTGKGFIGAFTRGKGEWCALQRPAGVLQVYYLDGIPSVNDIYEPDLGERVDLRAGVWHHCAAVFRMSSVVELYTDGRRVARIATTGRPFRLSDQMATLSLGGGILLDEVAILAAIPTEGALHDYVRGMRHLAEYASATKD